MNLRRLNDEGVRRMEAFLDSLTTDVPEAYPVEFLTDPAASEAIAVEVPVDQTVFPRRYELAEYLYKRFADAGIRDSERDAGIWAWLALYWFEQLCPKERDGRLKPGSRDRWIPRLGNSRRYYRHLVLGPWLIYRAHSDEPSRALALLTDPPSVATAEVYRLFIEGPLVASIAAVTAATQLYYDSDKRKLKRGFGVKTGGGARRLVAFLQQLDCTYDLHSMSSDHLMRCLPSEFSRFRRRARHR